MQQKYYIENYRRSFGKHVKWATEFSGVWSCNDGWAYLNSV